MREGCVFCEIASGERAADQLRSMETTMVFQPLNPVTPGHLLVCPKQHVEDVGSNHSITAHVFEVVARVAATMDSCNVITSRGEAATQSIRHLHVHVVPRRFGDGLKLPWTDQQSSDDSVLVATDRKGEGDA